MTRRRFRRAWVCALWLCACCCSCCCCSPRCCCCSRRRRRRSGQGRGRRSRPRTDTRGSSSPWPRRPKPTCGSPTASSSSPSSAPWMYRSIVFRCRPPAMWAPRAAIPTAPAVRLALARKVTVNSMAAGEKLFVDLLPEGWAGLPPGLPQEVDRGSGAARARGREEGARSSRSRSSVRCRRCACASARSRPSRATCSSCPELVPVSTDRAENRLTLTFDAPLRFDLADVQAALPPTIGAIETEPSAEKPAVRFAFIGKVDVRTFREDNNYVVDVQPIARELTVERPNPPTRVALRLVVTSARRDRANGRSRRRPAVAAPSRSAAGIRAAKRRQRRRRRRGQPAAAPTLAASPPEKSRPPPAGAARPRRPRLDPAAPVAVDVARQGDAAPCLSVRPADAGRGVPARRHALARVRQRGADRSCARSPPSRAARSATPR